MSLSDKIPDKNETLFTKDVIKIKDVREAVRELKSRIDSDSRGMEISQALAFQAFLASVRENIHEIFGEQLI